jgi:prepilin-type processing-associated H-X9-DG protein
MLVIVVAGLAGLFLFFALVMAALLLPAVQAAREAARRGNCSNNLRMIGIALQNYHDTYKSFPPAYVADDAGRPLHSWRVLILPFLDDPQATLLYEQYDFDEPWDGPHNRRLAEQPPFVFQCPSNESTAGAAHYVAVVGDTTMWPGAGTVAIGTLAEGDGTSGTIAVVETTGADISWMEPRDVTLEEAAQGIGEEASGGISSHHPGGVNVLMADGSARFVTDDVHRSVWRGLSTRDGGEVSEASL